MPGILEWYRQEGMIFARGAGAGVNVSGLRAAGEKIAKGGESSGPLSFMRAADASAFSIKSGGTTRRSARMVVMDVGHPDIVAFIDCKMLEERKARALAVAGFDASLDGDIYGTVAHQNANHSVRVSDAFMEAVRKDLPWDLRYVTTGEVAATLPARVIFRRLAESTHACGDPGMQFDDTINRWHTVPSSGRINASNPCSEFHFLDNTACNLASINLLPFWDGEIGFDTLGYVKACKILITAQEILVSRSSYPTREIAANSVDFRPLGLGPANLGALLMAMGLPYDSDEGRNVAACLQAIMTGAAYEQSALLAEHLGPFAGYAANAAAMQAVIEQHADAAYELPDVPGLTSSARAAWDRARAQGGLHGFRNAQVTVAAPTGTISFMMDCDTTGVEPDIALVNTKKLVGGGTLQQVNQQVPRALERLGYWPEAVYEALAYVASHGTLDGCPVIRSTDQAVFDCAFPAAPGGRAIAPEGHIRMVAALQPFLTGGISKTINLPSTATVEDIEAMYLLGWELGCKSLALYRDGCKQTQPLAALSSEPVPVAPEAFVPAGTPVRRRLPDERVSYTHKFSLGGAEAYMTVGLFPDGSPGELWLKMSKEGSTIAGLLDAFAIAVSLGLQYGVPLEHLCTKYRGMRFEPQGFTNHDEIHFATSIIDYVFRWLAWKFIPAPAGAGQEPLPEALPSPAPLALAETRYCLVCGTAMRPSGTCYSCTQCGATSGGCA